MATNQIRGEQIKDGAITNAKVASGAAIASTKLANWAADRDGGGFKLVNIAAPSSGTDAANKAYVDGVAQGLDVKLSVRACSTANVAGSYTATSGASARGQFTGMPNTIDGVTLAASDRVLLKDQSTGAQNGIWFITTLGSGSNGVWDRATDFDADADVTAGAFTFVEEGTANADTGWVLTTNGAIIIGGSSGTSIAFSQFSGAGSIVAGAGLTKTGSTLDVVAADTSLTVNADSIQVNLTGSTLAVASGLKVASAGITATELNTSVAGGGISGGGGTALAVDFVFEVPSGTVNGSNQAFVASNTIFSPTASTTLTTDVMVFINGLQIDPAQYTRSGTTVTITDAPLTGDIIRFWYYK
jgi:hypothetical protein